ncbi:MAG: hypothetical protein HYX68_06220 [Planctomycetes bacterium]|nr:hypothetical protein [Planctomycetota bacterium]
MSFIKGILTIYAFAMLWGLMSGLALVGIRYSFGKLLDGYLLAVPIVVGLALSILLLWLIDCVRSLRLTIMQHCAMIVALCFYCSTGVGIVFVVRMYSWYDLSSHQFGLSYLTYYLALWFGHLVIVMGLFFYFINLWQTHRNGKPQFDPQGLWLFQFALQPTRQFIPRSIGVGAFLMVSALIGVILIILEKRGPIHSFAAGVVGVVSAASFSAVLFRYLGLMRAYRLLLYSLEKSAIEAMALAGEMAREQDPENPEAIDQHIDLCNRFRDRLLTRIYSYAAKRQHQAYSLFLKTLVARGEKANQEFEKIANALHETKKDLSKFGLAIDISKHICADLRQVGDWVSFSDFSLEDQLRPDLRNAIEDLSAFLDEVDKKNRDERESKKEWGFGIAEITCLKTRGVWLEQIPWLLDLDVDRSGLLANLKAVLERARRSMTETLDFLANPSIQPGDIPSQVDEQKRAKLDHYIKNVSRRLGAVEALIRNDKREFLKLIQPDDLDLFSPADRSLDRPFFRFLVRLFPLDPAKWAGPSSCANHAA